MNLHHLERLVSAVGYLGLPKTNTNTSLPSIASNATLNIVCYLRTKVFQRS